MKTIDSIPIIAFYCQEVCCYSIYEVNKMPKRFANFATPCTSVHSPVCVNSLKILFITTLINIGNTNIVNYAEITLPFAANVKVIDLSGKGFSDTHQLICIFIAQSIISGHPVSDEGSVSFRKVFIPNSLHSDTSSIRKLKCTISVRNVFTPNSLQTENSLLHSDKSSVRI